MAKEKNIKEELLNQMDKKSGQTAMRLSQEIIARDTADVRRLKWITIFSWLLVIICFVVAAVIELNVRGIESDVLCLYTMWASIAALIFRAMLLVALVFTISLYIRSRTLSLNKIQARLANIEEQLKKLSQDK